MDYYRLQVASIGPADNAAGWQDKSLASARAQIERVHGDCLIKEADYEQVCAKLDSFADYDDARPWILVAENVGDSTVLMWAEWFARQKRRDDFIAVDEAFVDWKADGRLACEYADENTMFAAARFAAPMNFEERRHRNLMMVRVGRDFSAEYSMFMNHDVTMDVPAEMILIDLLIQYICAKKDEPFKGRSHDEAIAALEHIDKVESAIQSFLDSEEELWKMEYRGWTR